jgi:hypothetical protein
MEIISFGGNSRKLKVAACGLQPRSYILARERVAQQLASLSSSSLLDPISTSCAASALPLCRALCTSRTSSCLITTANQSNSDSAWGAFDFGAGAHLSFFRFKESWHRPRSAEVRPSGASSRLACSSSSEEPHTGANATLRHPAYSNPLLIIDQPASQQRRHGR